METLKKNLIKDAKRIVIKIGTRVITHDSGVLDFKRISHIVKQIVQLSSDHKKDIIVVSSGAIGAGMGKLKLKKRPDSLSDIQALASVGQSFLMETYRKEFNKHGFETGQILVTKEDFQNRNRYLNISNTLNALIKRKIIPIVNENDTVATFEITFGDNDKLTALINHTFKADLAIILSSIDGFMDFDNNKDGELIKYVTKIDKKILSKVSSNKSLLGSGGMKSKISAIKEIMNSGEPVMLINGLKMNILRDLFHGKDYGTLFLPKTNKLKSKKRWIAYSAKSNGEIIIDIGAKNALKNNSSLLAIGIKSIKGKFNRGDIVKISSQNNIIAKGLVNYNSSDLNKIKGLKSNFIKQILNENVYDEVIHKDNLVII